MVESILIIGFMIIFMVVTIGLSVGAIWIALREETHAPKPFRESAEDTAE